ncbi:MAG TPA: hypothetical protein VFD65_02045, partial [Chitinophagales bacterium]|nr:hypothetical protein [Chitinophagales bacterium]
IQKIKGFIEIGPRRDKDFLNMYLSTANNEWIFIRFIDGELSIITSDPSVNSEISNIKEKNRSLKSGKEIVYRVTLSNVQLKDNFLFRMNSFNGE